MVLGLLVADLPNLTRWIVTLGGMTIVLVAPLAARSMVAAVQLTEEGVTGPGFLEPVHIPWTEVILVTDDPNGVIVQSARRSTRIDLSTVTVRSTFGGRSTGASSTFGGTRIANFENVDEMVRFVLAHVPKSAMLELHYWMPT